LHPDRHEALKKRVVSAAEAALAHHQYVSAIDVLTGSGLLAPTHVDSWRKGRIDFLERAIQANLDKISQSMAIFRQWALEKGLKPSETRYVRRTRGGTVELQFSKSGNPAIETNYRTHYVSSSLSERKQERLREKLSNPAKPVVFEIVRDSACSECGAELARGSFLVMAAEQPLCLPCARLGDLEFLPAGDTALTRRSSRYSERTAVVVRFSRSRGRYERQGILVEQSALEKAEQECSEELRNARKRGLPAPCDDRNKTRNWLLKSQWKLENSFRAARHERQRQSRRTRPPGIADGWDEPWRGGVWMRAHSPPRSQPRFVIDTPITMRCSRAAWIAFSPGIRSRIGWTRFWMPGENSAASRPPHKA
jgi:hypothetical protein